LRLRIILDREIDDNLASGGGMARITVHLHGRAKDRSVRALIEDYQGRIKGRGIIVDEHLGQAKSPTDYETSIAALSGHLILLDEGGKKMSSVEFATMVGELSLASDPSHFAVGPANGFSAETKSIAAQLVSLSTMTTTHELAAVFLLEQLYRASEIKRGSPYHRE